MTPNSKRRVTNPHGDLAHGFVVAVEQAKVAGLRCVRRHRPADARCVEDLGVADQRFDVRLGEEVCRWSNQQHFRTLHVERHFDRHACIRFDVFFQTFKRIHQRRARQTEVVADLLHLAQNLVGIFLPHADVVENLTTSHGDFGGVDAVRAKHRAATAFRALVVIVVPVV